MKQRAGRAFAILGSAIFLVIAPGTVAGLAPWMISGWRLQPPLLGVAAFRAAGAFLILAALPGLLDSFWRFAIQGLGTPAPVFPTRQLVSTGLYRYVRNPMYLAVVSAIFGQGLWFGSPQVLGYGALVWAAFHVFVLAYEEPTLREAYGAQYEDFRKNVPRWIPRLRAWQALFC